MALREKGGLEQWFGAVVWRIGLRVPHNHLKVSMSNHTNFMSKQLPLFLKAMLECIRQLASFRTLFYHKIK